MPLSNGYYSIVNREKGQFAISIPTSLALESLLNIHPDTKHEDLPIKKIDHLFVNVRTLFRNLYGSIDRTKHISLQIDEYAFGLEDDIERLQDFCKENNLTLVLYHSNYKDIEKRFKRAKPRIATTESQIHFKESTENTIKYLFKRKVLRERKSTKDNSNNTFIFKDHVKSPLYVKAAILTHIPFDLLDDYSFLKLYLLESNIGNFKPYNKWYTKYYGGSKFQQPLPFNLPLLQILGDSYHFSPLGVTIKRELFKLAEKKNWNPTTTLSQIKSSLTYIEDKNIRELFQDICSYDK